MFGARDLVWSALICAALTLLFQCRPQYSARRMLERDARDAFLEAYKGRRDLTGEVVSPAGQGVHVDPMAGPITHRRFEILADRLSWAGNKAELVALHVVEVVGEPPARVEAHVKLEKRGSRWVYTQFAVRDGPSFAALDMGNPWLIALRPPSEDEEPLGEPIDDDDG
jgi:hypothetical protein